MDKKCASRLAEWRLLFRRPLQPLLRRGEFGFELFHGGEGELVFAGHDFVRERVEGEAAEGRSAVDLADAPAAAKGFVFVKASGVFVFREEPEADVNLRAEEKLAGDGAADGGVVGMFVHEVNAGAGRARRGLGR